MILTDFLKRVPLFSELTDDELKNLEQKAEVLCFPRDAFICKEGQQADTMFIIKSGIVQIFCDDGTGGKKILTHLKLGEYFGEMALLTAGPRTASVVALAETEVIRLKKVDFDELLKTHNGVCISIIKTLCNRLSKTNIGGAQIKSHNVFAVMGPDTSSGKSLFARNLALAMSHALKEDVLLYDPNLRDDRVARMLSVKERSKIIDELVARERIADISKYVVKTPCGLLTILPQENGITDCRLKEFHTYALMSTVMENYKYIVVDSSSMFTKVTKEIVQNCNKIIYLISSKNVSVAGLMDYFDKTRREWNVSPDKVVFGINHNTNNTNEEGVITDKDRARTSFEIPFIPEFKGVRDPHPDGSLTVQSNPEHALSKISAKVANEILYDQKIGLCIPTFAGDVAKSNYVERWIESGLQEFAVDIKDVTLSDTVSRNEKPFKIIFGCTSKWQLNEQVVKVVDFANRFKKEFDVKNVYLTLNGEESTI